MPFTDIVARSTTATTNAGPATPRHRVARSWHGGALPLGLDAPFRLLGGDALAPDRIAADLALDWVPGLQEHVAQACHDQSVADRPWFTMPPSVVSGPNGIGATLMARRIARCAGVPFATIDVSAWSGIPVTGAPARGPDLPMPSPIVTIMATAACANPLVLITGIDTADSDAVATVQAMVDPATSMRWNEPSIGAVVDLSQVSWIIRSSATAGVPRPLARLHRIETVLDDEARRLRDLTIVSEIMDDLGVEPRSVADHAGALLEPLRTSKDRSAAGLRLVAERAVWALTRAAR